MRSWLLRITLLLLEESCHKCFNDYKIISKWGKAWIYYIIQIGKKALLTLTYFILLYFSWTSIYIYCWQHTIVFTISRKFVTVFFVLLYSWNINKLKKNLFCKYIYFILLLPSIQLKKSFGSLFSESDIFFHSE